MFPPKKEPKGVLVYAGHRISLGIQLVVDGNWRYKLQNDEQLTVQLRTPADDVVLSKVYTAADVDPEDKIVNITFDGAETNIPDGDYFLVAFVDDFVVFKPQPVRVRKVVYHE